VVEGEGVVIALSVQEGESRKQAPAKDPVSALMEVERALRELASDLQLRKEPFREVRRKDISRMDEALSKLYGTFVEEGSWFESVYRLIRAGHPHKGLDYDALVKAEQLHAAYSATVRALRAAIYAAIKCEGLPHDDPFCIDAVRAENARSLVEDLAEEVRALTGRECGFGIRVKETTKKYDLPALLNDISNCVHVVAEWLPKSGLPTSVRRVSERCVALGDADEDLLDLCSIWDQKVRTLKGLDAYSGGDYDELLALIGPEEATFRVGSAARHATRVGRDGRFAYYDDDIPVVNVVRSLMESLDYSCTMPSHNELTCTPPSPDVLKDRSVRARIADVMSWVTSADFRLQKRFREFCEVSCRDKMKAAGEGEFWRCVNECVDGIWEEEKKKREEAEKGARIRPHPIAVRDLANYGITWWRGTGR
jgi:hypothetical protein